MLQLTYLPKMGLELIYNFPPPKPIQRSLSIQLSKRVEHEELQRSLSIELSKRVETPSSITCWIIVIHIQPGSTHSKSAKPANHLTFSAEVISIAYFPWDNIIYHSRSYFPFMNVKNKWKLNKWKLIMKINNLRNIFFICYLSYSLFNFFEKLKDYL